MANGVTVCSPDEALALIAVYLRSQGQFITWRAQDGFTMTMNHGLYYWVGTRELLPAGWRWFSACVEESSATRDDTLLDLGQSLLRRVQRALESRDRFHRAFNLPQNNDTSSAVLTELDSVLISLMGAVDGSARVAHLVLGLAGHMRNAAWQRQQWLQLVADREPTLAALFGTGTPLEHTLTILGLLRNTVHGQMMRTVIVQPSANLREIVIRLPAADEAVLLTAMDALGGRARWGTSQSIRGGFVTDPHAFIENLIPEIVTLLNQVMEKTPVEQLTHVRVTPASCQPPTPTRAGEADTFGQRNRLSIRWQLGF